MAGARRKAEAEADASRTLLPKIWEFIQDTFFPAKRREREEQRRRLEEQRDARDLKAREVFAEESQNKSRAELDDLPSLHEQQTREQAAKLEAEKERYLRENEAARRFLEELRRDEEKTLIRDGPGPPTRAR